jgi:hypothetical protein
MQMCIRAKDCTARLALAARHGTRQVRQSGGEEGHEHVRTTWVDTGPVNGCGRVGARGNEGMGEVYVGVEMTVGW